MAVTIKNNAGNTISSVKLLLNNAAFWSSTGPSMSVNFHTVKFLTPIIHYFHICHLFSYSSSCSYLPLHTAQQYQPTRNPCTEKFSNQFSVNFVLFCFIFPTLLIWRMVYLFYGERWNVHTSKSTKGLLQQLLGMFAKLSKLPISFAISVCLSIHMEQLSS